MPSSTKSKRSSRARRITAGVTGTNNPVTQTAEAAVERAREEASAFRRKSDSVDAPAIQITNYTTAQKWLYAHFDHERQRLVKYSDQTFDLDRTRKLLDLIGNPHHQLQCVHVAGTKGKGSVCAMTASMLEACGYTVGLFTSPHLIDVRERIQINGQMISYSDMSELCKEIAAVEPKFIASRGIHAPLTFFEIMTAAAFKHFADQAVDIVVLETGLGGRLDCTNVCEPLVTAITGISLDHTHLLGDTLGKIAKEKAGIFKPGVPALTLNQSNSEITNTLRDTAEDIGTKLEICGKDIDFSYRFEANKELGPHTRVCLTTKTSKFEHLPVPLRGEHQALNCGLALAIIDRLKAHGFQLPENQVIQGLEQTELPGRMEQVWPRPQVILDGAHNASSLQALIKALGAHIQYDSLVMIFGCAQDKDVDAMLEQISLGADKVIFTRAKANPRSSDPEDLKRKFDLLSAKMAQTAKNLPEALQLANRAVSREDLVIICGSFYLAGEARKYFIRKQEERDKAKA